MRKYQAAWEQLRDNPNEPLVIAAPPAWHNRIYKAIIKEKDEDLVFKLTQSDAGQFSKLSRKSSGGQLLITIRFYPRLSISTGDF